MARFIDSRRAGASLTDGGGSVKHCTWKSRGDGHEGRGEEVWPGIFHSHPPSLAATTPSGSHPRMKCGILDSRNMNVTVCHSCSHAPGAPGKPRQTPRVEAGHAPLSLAPASSPNTFMQNTQWRSECSQKPSKLQSPHLATEALP